MNERKGNRPMSTAVNDLITIMATQTGNYYELKQLILKMRKAIFDNNLKGLSEATSQIETLIAGNNQLELKRIAHVDNMAKDMGVGDSKPTLAQIAGHFEDPISAELLNLRCDTIKAIRDVQRENQINSEMLKYCADLMDSTLRYLMDGDSFESTYGSSGETRKNNSKASLLDQHF